MKARPDVPGRLLVSLVLLAIGLTALFATPAAAAAPCDPPIANAIVCENSKPGNPPSEWDIAGAGTRSIQGFATDISVDQGQTVHFKIDTASTDYHLDIYRMGYYGGDGARKVATVTPSASLPQNQPRLPERCRHRADRLRQLGRLGLLGGAGGRRLGHLLRQAHARRRTPGGSHIVFIVRDDGGHSDLLFQTSDTTWQAYNQYGGNSLYTGSSGDLRQSRLQGQLQPPVHDPRRQVPRTRRFNAEYPMVRWLSETATTSATSPGWTPTAAAARSSSTRPTSRSATTSTGPARSGPTSKRPATRGSTSPSSAATRSSGRPAGRTASTAPAPTTAPWSPTRRPTPTPRSIPTPTWTGTWRDPRFSPAGRRRSP